MMTHEAREAGIQAALKEIDALPVTQGKTQLIRTEDESIKDENL